MRMHGVQTTQRNEEEEINVTSMQRAIMIATRIMDKYYIPPDHPQGGGFVRERVQAGIVEEVLALLKEHERAPDIGSDIPGGGAI